MVEQVEQVNKVQTLVSQTADNSMTLLDIELPLSPDFDWLGLLTTSLYWLFIVMILAGLVSLYLMLKTRHQPFVKQSVLLHFILLRKQLKNLRQSMNLTSNEQSVSKTTITDFYALVQRLDYISGILQSHSATETLSLTPLKDLKELADLMVFAKQTVSRENVTMAIEAAHKQINTQLTSKQLASYYWQIYGQKIKQISSAKPTYKRGRK